MSADHPTAEELAISEFRREVAVGMTEIGGQLALLVQRAGQSDERFSRVDRAVEDLDKRTDAIERTQVTRSDLDEKGRKTLLLVSTVTAVITAVVAFVAVIATILAGGN